MVKTYRKPKLFLSVIALIIALYHLVPFYILLTTAFKAKGDFSSKWMFPKQFSFENFSEAWEMANLGQSLWNTVIITFFSAVLLIIVGSLAAYPLARRTTKANKLVYVFLSR